MEQLHHPVTTIVSMKVKFGSHEKIIRLGLFGNNSSLHVQNFKQMCSKQQKIFDSTQQSQTQQQGLIISSLINTNFYKYNEDVGFFIGDSQNIKEVAVKSDKMQNEKSEHFPYCLTTYTSETNMTSNTFILVTSRSCDFLNDKHQLIGQVVDRESIDVVEELKKFAIVENCCKVSDNSEIKIVEIQCEDK